MKTAEPALMNDLNKINVKSFMPDEYDDLLDEYNKLFEEVADKEIENVKKNDFPPWGKEGRTISCSHSIYQTTQ